jgi:hypothetical protein
MNIQVVEVGYQRRPADQMRVFHEKAGDCLEDVGIQLAGISPLAGHQHEDEAEMILASMLPYFSDSRLAEAVTRPTAGGGMLARFPQPDTAFAGYLVNIDSVARLVQLSPRAAFSAKYTAGSIRLTSDAAPKVPSL